MFAEKAAFAGRTAADDALPCGPAFQAAAGRNGRGYPFDYITAGRESQSISTKLAVSLSSLTVSAVSVWAVPVLL